MQKSKWHDIKGFFPWPSVESIERRLGENGLRIESMRLVPLGVRTAEIIGVWKGSGEQVRFCLARQRDPDPRVVCPLDEEFQVLCQIHARSPGLVPEPMVLSTSDKDEPLMVLNWVYGDRLGRRLRSGEHSEEVVAIIYSALHNLHMLGIYCDLSRVTRQIRIKPLVENIERSPLRGVLLPSTIWDQVIAVAYDVIDKLSLPTLLHGDAHAYNLIESSQGPCLLDFELLAVGPPEIDNARSWVLLQTQTQGLASIFRSHTQLVCDFMVATSFLTSQTDFYNEESKRYISSSIKSIVKQIL